MCRTTSENRSSPNIQGHRLSFTLPWPPSANRYWRTYRNRTVVSAEAKAYKQEVGYLLNQHVDSPLSGSVVISIFVFRPRRAGDLDNRLKVTLDSLNGLAYDDDSQITEIHAYRHDDKHNPRIEIVIEEVDA